MILYENSFLTEGKRNRKKNYLTSLSQWLTEQGLGETKFTKWFKRRDIVESNDCQRPKGT